MSYTTNDTDAAAAIARSISHDEIVTILVADEAERAAVVDALRDAADVDHEIDDALNGETHEVWGYDPNARGSSAWRVHVMAG